MPFWVTLLLWAGVTALNRIFQPRVPKPSNAAPERFAGITAEEGRVVPIIWGTRRIKNANIAWYGDQSQVAIVQSGVTTGYKYYLGAQYLICLGPIDDIVSVEWNEKSLGQPLTAAQNQIVFGDGPIVTAAIPPGFYANGEALALACENAMKAAQPGNWKVAFGFYVVSNRTDELVYSIYTPDGVGTYADRIKVKIPAGSYNGVTLAAAIATAMNNSRPGVVSAFHGIFSCSWDNGTHKFNIYYSQTQSIGPYWRLHTSPADGVTYSKSALILVGLKMNVGSYQDSVDPNVAVGITSDYAVIQNRFLFAFAGSTGLLKATDAGFTAATILGVDTAADRTLLNYTGITDLVVVSASYTYNTDASGTHLDIVVDAPGFFGTEGGVTGEIIIVFGSLAQISFVYLRSLWGLGTDAPGFRGICYAIQKGMYIGNTNYPKPIAFTVRRCPNQLGLTGEMHNIAGDANPAAMLWEILTDSRWGLGIPQTYLNKSAFMAVGAALAAEELGLSMIVDTDAPALEIVDEILRHIDGAIYLDALTGLLSIQIARNDYVIADLPRVTIDNADHFSLKRRSLEETRNVVKLHYVDRDAAYQERTVTIQDLANIQSRNGDLAIEEFSFPGISNLANATIVANRVLKAVSHTPAEIAIKANRELYALRPGSPFRLTLTPLGITDMPCRIGQIGTGMLERGGVSFDAVEDLAGPAWSGFIPPSAPSLDDPEPVDLAIVAPGDDDAALIGDIPIGSS